MSRSTHIGAYRILRLINQGGQGTVYLGFDERLHRRVAIKIYRLPRKKVQRRGLLAEAQLIASIQSPKIVQIYDLVVATDHVAFIMEYVPGCDLEELLERGDLSLSSVLTVCMDVTAALAVARQQHIVHGDLKASNILVTRAGRVKLTDFGIARVSDSPDSNLNTAASISCISPEQYLGKLLDVRSDLFALGCLLYRMLTAKHAFVRSGELSPEALLGSRPRAVEELVPESVLLPVALIKLLDALLEKAPNDRPRDTHQVRSALRKISREIPLSVGNTLLHESENYFRTESAEDVPPIIPGDLTRNGRSKLRRISILPEILSSRRFLAFVFMGIVLSGLLGSFLLRAFFPDEQRIVIEPAGFTIETEAEFPDVLSPDWITGEIEQALHSRLASVRVLDKEPRDNFLSAGVGAGLGAKRVPVELHLRPTLHCVGNLCLFDLELTKEGENFSQQKLILSSMPVSKWSDLVRAATVALLDQSS